MRPVAFVTLALAVAACQGKPLGQRWQVDEQGKAVPGTETPVWTEEEVEVLRQALVFNVAYNVDCGATRTPYAGEVLLFDGQNYTAECNAIRGSGTLPVNMVIPYNDSTAAWASGKSWNDQVSSMRAADPHGMCIQLRQTVGGADAPGWGPAKFELGPNGTLNLPSMFPWGDASFIVVGLKNPGQGPGC
jgi:hypothetical protein